MPAPATKMIPRTWTCHALPELERRLLVRTARPEQPPIGRALTEPESRISSAGVVRAGDLIGSALATAPTRGTSGIGRIIF